MMRQRDARRGSSVVELALSGTVLLFIAFGAADFAKLFYNAIAVANSANSGVTYAVTDVINAGDFNAITAQVQADAERDASTVTTTVTQICKCPTGDPFPCINYTTAGAGCSGYGLPRGYVQVDVEENWNSLSGLPLFRSLDIDRRAVMRVR